MEQVLTCVCKEIQYNTMTLECYCIFFKLKGLIINIIRQQSKIDMLEVMVCQGIMSFFLIYQK
jgi:hypothetical protein